MTTKATEMGRASPADQARLRKARITARRRVVAIDAARRILIRAAFRDELANTVTCASPYLIALLADGGRTLADVAGDIRPVPGWPRRPRLETNRFLFPKTVPDMWLRALPLSEVFHGCCLADATGWPARLHVLGHSLEVGLVIGEARIETRFGVLRVGLGGRIPDALATACVGRSIDAIVDHASLTGRDWIVTGVEDRSPNEPQTLLVSTGSEAFRMPWAADGTR